MGCLFSIIPRRSVFCKRFFRFFTESAAGPNRRSSDGLNRKERTMDPYLQIKDNELIVPGLRDKRVFFHISDTHLSVRDDLSTEEEARQAEEWEARWMVGKENFARGFGEPFGDAQRITTVEGFEKLLAFAREEKPDALLFTGDNLECMHPAGERYLAEKMKDCPLPFLCVPGNHESSSLPGVWEPGVKVLDYGDFRIAGADDRLGSVSAEDLGRGKPLPYVLKTALPQRLRRALFLLLNKVLTTTPCPAIM